MEFCPICYRQTEKEIWKKENKFKESRWIFCPNHGYIKEEQQRITARPKRNIGKKFLGINSSIKKGSIAIYNEIISTAGRVLIMSTIFTTMSVCFILGYFVGTSAKNSPHLMYSVQVGAFSNASHAISLKTLLDAKGYTADIEEPKSIKEGQLYRVCIGKLSNRDSAKILSARIEAAEGIKAFVIPLEEVSR